MTTLFRFVLSLLLMEEETQVLIGETQAAIDAPYWDVVDGKVMRVHPLPKIKE
jgi:hypothetical protein